MQQPELWKSVLGRQPLEKHTSNPRRGNKARKVETMMEALSTEDGTKLVATARQAIADHLGRRNTDPTSGEGIGVSVARGVFVTLLDEMTRRGIRSGGISKPVLFEGRANAGCLADS